MSADAQQRRLGRTALVGRLLSAHFLCYPLMFVGAAAGMSLAIVTQKEALYRDGLTQVPQSAFQHWLIERVSLGVGDAAVFERVITPVGWGLAVIFVLAHLAAVPWGLAARRQALGQAGPEIVRRARNLWILASLGPTGLLVVAGLVGWSIIFFSS